MDVVAAWKWKSEVRLWCCDAELQGSKLLRVQIPGWAGQAQGSSGAGARLRGWIT